MSWTPPGVMSAQTAMQVLRTPRSYATHALERARRLDEEGDDDDSSEGETGTDVDTDQASMSTTSPVASPTAAAAAAATRRSTEGNFGGIVEEEEAGKASVPAGAKYGTDEQSVDVSLTQQNCTTKIGNEASAWGRYYDESEQTFYWYNTATGESSWSDPNYSS